MGNLTAKDTRRISFDNTVTMNNALSIPKRMQDDDILEIEPLETKKSDLMSSKESIEISKDEHDYWAYRIEILKNEHQAINKIIEREYETTIEKTKSIIDTNPKTFDEKFKKVQRCFNWRSKILKCYEDNPHQPLLCSANVEAFCNCVASFYFEE
ncbi:MICOS complex subunit MIC25-like [Leptidea sinapis]|uniref:MICOS complex subunit MIC25-like n=1 Tax=Leptidea sinapis TaxID=189913 RepID=UPI00212FC6B4|nr:MICOS complex subunit MIC25-like [Leptidea sinapis]